MRKVWSVLAVNVLVALVLAGCGSQPAQEIQAAKGAVDGVVADGGEKFAPAETKGVADALNAAMEEVKTQDAKYFKNYDKAKEMLVKAKADAETLKTGLAAKKEQAKSEATTPASSSPNCGPPMKKIMLTEVIRPRSASGVMSWRMVCRMTASAASPRTTQAICG